MNPLEQYNSIVDYWKKNPLVKGGEVHHIIPRSCGGCDKKWNKVRMPTLEHIKCHRLLCDIYPVGEEHKAMAAAYDLMLTTREGVKVSEEEAARARDEARKARKGRKTFLGKHHTEEWKLQNSLRHRGRKRSEETRRRISEARKNLAGKLPPKSEEFKRAASERMKGNEYGKGNKGHKCSEEKKAKISKALTGRVGCQKGRPKSPEWRAKISKTLTGRKTGPRSEEIKQKISEGQRLRWARQKQLAQTKTV